MNRKTMLKAVLAMSVALAFILPGSAAFANVGTIGVTSNSKNTGDINIILDSTFKYTTIAEDESWPMFRHDQIHTGYTAGTAPNTNNVLWNYTAGGQVLSSPAVVDGKVYCASYEDNKTFCLNEQTGSLIWTFTANGFMPYSSPAVNNGKVYIGSNDKNLYCLNAANGAKIWNYTVGGGNSCPTVVDGKVYVGSSDNKVYCLNADTGAFIWSFATGMLAWCSPAVVDGKVYIGSMDFKMYCLNANNGSMIWNFPTGMIIYSSPAVVDGKVYFGSWDHKVYSLNANNGSLVWSHDIGQDTLGAIFSSPAVYDGKVYIGVDWVPQGGFYCLKVSDGSVVWNHTLNGAVYGSPAIADGKVYIGTCQDNGFYCFDAQNGTQIWKYTAGNYITSSPAIANGKVFVGSNDKHLYCFGPQIDVTEVKGGLFKISAKIKNNGITEANVNWSITLTGGLILFGKQTTGNVTISAGEEVVVKSKFIVGLGKTTIAVTAGDAEKTANATVLFVYIKMA